MTNAILSIVLLMSASTASLGRDYADLFEFWDDLDAFTAQSFADWRVTRRAKQAKTGDYYFESGAKRLVISLALKGSAAEAEAVMTQTVRLGRSRPDSSTALRVGDAAHSWRTSDGGGGVVFRRENLIVEITSTVWAEVERFARRVDEFAVRIGRTENGAPDCTLPPVGVNRFRLSSTPSLALMPLRSLPSPRFLALCLPCFTGHDHHAMASN